MTERTWLAEQFEQSRPHLEAVAYSMLGTVSEAQDAVQEAWLRLDRSEADRISDLQGWLVTVVGRISLDMLRARKARREYAVGSWLPEPLVSAADEDPAGQAELADSLSLALLVVLESLSPAERLSFVLHDVFAVPFGEIGRIMGRTPDSARQLASRARRRVQAAPRPDPDLSRQRAVVDAFLAAARSGDFTALLAVLDPDVVFRADAGPGSPLARPVLVNGEAGALFGSEGEPVAVLGFTITGGRIAALDLIADPAKLANLAIEPCTGRTSHEGGSP